MPRRPPRDLTPEEQAEWERVTQTAAPLTHAKKRVEKAPPALPPAPKPRPAPPPARTGSVESPPPVAGDLTAMDGATARRIRRGDYPISRTLDLHGMTREQAFAALHAAVGAAYRRGERMLLVITGKGRGSEGVLKAELPRFLAADDISDKVLAFERARQEHGGGGAFYVFVRRKRN